MAVDTKKKKKGKSARGNSRETGPDGGKTMSPAVARLVARASSRAFQWNHKLSVHLLEERRLTVHILLCFCCLE